VRLGKTLPATNIQKSNCRFQATTGEDGKPILKVDLFHQTVPSLKGLAVEFEVMGGTTAQQMKALAESMNDRIIGIVVTSA